jgi:hypothetical protein
MTRIKARPTSYKGIEMRSRLEAGFAAWLDQKGFLWEYEPGAFASEQGQYLPDFCIRDLVAHGVQMERAYVEVKPNQDDVHVVADRMRIIHESDPTALLLFAWPNVDSTQSIGQGAIQHQVVLQVTPDNILICFWAATPRGRTPQIAALLAADFAPWPDGYWGGHR